MSTKTLPDFDIDRTFLESDYVSSYANIPLRVCCYGSSSSQTPDKFLKEAWKLGYILGKRGHTCVNGAGSCGCMAAMNDGADFADGHIVGVIHEMFIVDGKDWWCERDGGAHNVFGSNSNESSSGDNNPTREILIAGGHNLQERKRLLVEGADALVVLPGGPGTWDELWEMSCARNLGLTNLPIVCVSVDGFYDNFHDMLARAYAEGLVKNQPEDVVHFVPSAEEAVRWIEQQKARPSVKQLPKVKKRDSILRKTSFFSPSTFMRSMSWLSEDDDNDGILGALADQTWPFLSSLGISFTVGIALGFVAASQFAKHPKL